MKKNTAKQEMFLCECHSEGVLASKFPEDDEVYLSFWRQGLNPIKLDFVTRVKLCWQILTTGTPYVDEVVLSSQSTRKLCDFLSKITAVKPKKK